VTETQPLWPAAIADEHLLPWFEEVRSAVPGGELFDAHTHVGFNDPDGFKLAPEQLVAGLGRAHARGVVFPMHEPDGYPPANDTVIELAAASGGRLVAFARLDPADDPLAEAERALTAGVRGIKLHPRAERFELADPRLEGVFALADERRLPVLVHAGRGIPALGRHAVELCERHPGLRIILAHAGICDLSWIWAAADELPNLFFDSAWWSAADLLALFTLVPPGQIVWASDAPYGSPVVGACIGLRCAQQAGLSGDALRAVSGGGTPTWDRPSGPAGWTTTCSSRAWRSSSSPPWGGCSSAPMATRRCSSPAWPATSSAGPRRRRRARRCSPCSTSTTRCGRSTPTPRPASAWPS
jgi:uncharacterized protein